MSELVEIKKRIDARCPKWTQGPGTGFQAEFEDGIEVLIHKLRAMAVTRFMLPIVSRGAPFSHSVADGKIQNVVS